MKQISCARWTGRKTNQLWFGLMFSALILAGCNQDNPARLAPGVVAQMGQINPTPPSAARHTAEGELSEQALIQYGADLYTVNCAPCHQANGEGNLARFPALNGNAFVTAQQPQPLIQTVLYGRGVMPSFAPTLSDPELAAILSYIRNTWNNDAAVISATQINQVKAATTPTPARIGKEMGQTTP